MVDFDSETWDDDIRFDKVADGVYMKNDRYTTPNPMKVPTIKRDHVIMNVPMDCFDRVVEDDIVDTILRELRTNDQDAYWVDLLTDDQFEYLMDTHVPGFMQGYDRDAALSDRLDGDQFLSLMEDPLIEQICHGLPAGEFWLDSISDMDLDYLMTKYSGVLYNGKPTNDPLYRKVQEVECTTCTFYGCGACDNCPNCACTKAKEWRSETAQNIECKLSDSCSCPACIDGIIAEISAERIAEGRSGEEVNAEMAELTKRMDDAAMKVDQYKAKQERLALGEELKCFCLKTKMYMCAICGVEREGLNKPWTKLATPYQPVASKERISSFDNMTPGTTVPKVTSTYTPGSYGGWEDEYDWYAWSGSDRHYGTIVNIQDVDFYASSMHNTRKDDDFVPDFGLYMDWGWRPYWRNEHIDWPDFNIPTDFVIAFEQILSAVEMAQAGLNVEFGCIGGHGRTGTALAIAGVILGMSADDAIAYVQDAYCKHAIETYSQEWYVGWCHAQIHGLEVPEYKPTYTKYSSNANLSPTHPVKKSTAPTVTVTCKKLDHFESWDNGMGMCPKFGEACKYWATDVRDFQAGKDPNLPGTYDPHTGIAGYWVPDPTRVGKPITTSSGEKRKVVNHDPQAKQGCKCDVCRYVNLGYGAMMEPISKGNEWYVWDEDMRYLENLYNERLFVQREGVIKVAQSDGTILMIEITDDFSQHNELPPTVKAKNGERKGEYVYLDGEGWVWERLAEVSIKQQNFKKKTKKQRKAARKAERLGKDMYHG